MPGMSSIRRAASLAILWFCCFAGPLASAYPTEVFNFRVFKNREPGFELTFTIPLVEKTPLRTREWKLIVYRQEGTDRAELRMGGLRFMDLPLTYTSTEVSPFWYRELFLMLPDEHGSPILRIEHCFHVTLPENLPQVFNLPNQYLQGCLIRYGSIVPRDDIRWGKIYRYDSRRFVQPPNTPLLPFKLDSIPTFPVLMFADLWMTDSVSPEVYSPRIAAKIREIEVPWRFDPAAPVRSVAFSLFDEDLYNMPEVPPVLAGSFFWYQLENLRRRYVAWEKEMKRENLLCFERPFSRFRFELQPVALGQSNFDVQFGCVFGCSHMVTTIGTRDFLTGEGMTEWEPIQNTAYAAKFRYFNQFHQLHLASDFVLPPKPPFTKMELIGGLDLANAKIEGALLVDADKIPWTTQIFNVHYGATP